MKIIRSVFDLIDKVLSFTISALLASMTAAIFYQVILRYIFKRSNIWAEEYARYAFIWIVMLGSVVAMRRYKHLRIDFFINQFSPKLKKIVEGFTYFLMSTFLVGIFIYGLQIAGQTSNQLSSGLHIPMSFMYMSIPIGSALMLASILEIIWNDFVYPFISNVKPNTPKKI